MLLDIRIQKNGTIVVRAPDDQIFTFKLDPENKAKVLQDLGDTIVTMLADTSMPPETLDAGHMSKKGRVHVDTQPGPEAVPVPTEAGPLEIFLRQAMDSVVPGSSILLTKAQDLPSSGDS